jgi:flagellar motor switch protein FliN/FliY
MAAAQPLTVSKGELKSPEPARAKGQLSVSQETQALVPAPRVPEAREEAELSAPVARLPVELDVAVPVRNFRVRNLLALTPGQLIETQWCHGNDLPLAAGEVLLAWSEFEVVESRLAVRVTRLA